MSAFKSLYDREFELQAQEEHKAYQRGFNAGRKSVLDKIREEIKHTASQPSNYPCDTISIKNVLEIIDHYKEVEDCK